jgi:hypothetical protein
LRAPQPCQFGVFLLRINEPLRNEAIRLSVALKRPERNFGATTDSSASSFTEESAMWDDTKLGLKHLTGWERMAIVSDIEWIRAAIKIFGLVIPGHVRVFYNNELAEATRWISE